MSTIDEVLNKNEKILWRGKPVWKPYFFWRLLGSLFLALFFGGWLGLTFLREMFMAAGYGSFAIPVFVTLTVAIFAVLMLYFVLVYKYIDYTITDKRIFVQGGLIGRDFESIDFDNVQDINVNVGWIDRIFNTGSVVGTSAGMKTIELSSIREPYDVFKLFKKSAFDVKAEMKFPSAYRPKTSKGYRTRYEP
jgi:membrane protein YdbS with pleckstrin-like domain